MYSFQFTNTFFEWEVKPFIVYLLLFGMHATIIWKENSGWNFAP